MKKILILIGIIIVIVMVFSLNIFGNSKNINIDVLKLSQELKNSQIFDDNLVEIDKNIVIKRYGFNEGEIKNIKSYVGSGATSEEILILELFDKAYLKENQKLIENTLEERKTSYENYLPKEVFKLENYSLVHKNNYIFLCISNNSNKAKDIIEQYIKS